MIQTPAVYLLDVTLRDGSHAMKHQFTEEQVREIVRGLEESGIEYIEVSHADGLGGSSIQYGFSEVDELKLIEAAAEESRRAKISVLFTPGIGLREDLQDAAKAGARMVRVATHVMEADTAQQYIELGRELGLKTVGFLMMAHVVPVKKLVEQAKLLESYGAEAVYIADSAGTLLPQEVKERVEALRGELQCDVGFHAYNNLSMAVANSIAAVEAGATYIDGSLRSLGAGGGNAQMEVLVAILERMGIRTWVDLYPVMDLADRVVASFMHRPQEITGSSLLMGYTGVYSGFLHHAHEAAEKFGVDARDILIEMGRRQTVAGQKDMVWEVAVQLANEHWI